MAKKKKCLSAARAARRVMAAAFTVAGQPTIRCKRVGREYEWYAWHCNRYRFIDVEVLGKQVVEALRQYTHPKYANISFANAVLREIVYYPRVFLPQNLQA